MNAVILVAAITVATPITLEEVRAQSRQNADVLLAQLDQEAAVEQSRAARSAIFPQVSLNGTAGGAFYGPQRIFSTVPTTSPTGTVTGFTQRSVDVEVSSSRASFDLAVSLQQLIYDGGRWWAQIAQAGALEAAQAGQTQERRLASELEGVRRFYELLRAQEALEVLEANLRRSEEQLRSARALFEAGRGQKVDVLGAEVNLGNDRLAVVQQRARIADAQAQLAVWLMRPGTEELIAQSPPTFDAPPTPGPDAAEAIARARQARPLLGALEAQVRAAEHGVDVARGDNLPAVYAGVTVGRQGPSADPFFTDPSRQNYVQGGLNVRWDLFNGFRTSSEVQRAQIARRRATVEMDQQCRELEAEVRTAAVNLATRVEAAAIARANVAVASEGLALAQARYAQGLGSTLDVRDAQLKLTQAELTLVENRIDVEIARAALDRAMGRGVTP
ncbi:MAG: TolC family protein [Myxococcaceae bacterium]|nr:TolC family protein [Myxococcaceae bacterium]